MVEKGSDHSSDKSPSTPEQVVQRTYSLQSARSGGKNSKVSDQETPPVFYPFDTFPCYLLDANDGFEVFKNIFSIQQSALKPHLGSEHSQE